MSSSRPRNIVHPIVDRHVKVSGKRRGWRNGCSPGKKIIDKTERYYGLLFHALNPLALSREPIVETVHQGIGQHRRVSYGQRTARIPDHVGWGLTWKFRGLRFAIGLIVASNENPVRSAPVDVVIQLGDRGVPVDGVRSRK